MTLKEIRKKKGLTQTQLGEVIGISQRSVSAYESRKNLTLRTAKRLADALEINLDQLWNILHPENKDSA